MKALAPASFWHKIAQRSIFAIRKTLHSVARFTMYSSVPSIFLISSLLIARYLPNSDFSYPSEIVLPITLFAFLATGIFYTYQWTFRRTFPGKNVHTATLPAHIASFLLLYALYGFSYAFPVIQKAADALLPSSLTTAFSSAITRVLLLAGIFWLLSFAIAWVIRRIKTINAAQLLKLVVFVVCFIFAWQGIQFGVRVWTIRKQLSYSYTATLPTKPAATPTQNAGSLQNTSPLKPAKPNVYYLLFDRYADSETLKTVYNYNNDAFNTYLESNGFVNREVAYANYPFTHGSVASTLSMTYLNDLSIKFKGDAGNFQTNFPYRSTIRNASAPQVFKENGYQYNHISSWWDVTRVGIKADSEPAKSFRLQILGLTFWLTDLQRDILYRSALLPLFEKGITVGNTTFLKYDQNRNPTQNFHDQIQAIKDIAAQSDKPQKPHFTFAHLLSPHDPYIFDKDGNSAPYNGDRTDQDVDEYTKYTNQLTYVTTQIQDLISDIRKNDPEAVILFQPDEGPYPKEFRGQLTPNNYFDPKNLQDDASLRQKFGITASYYMPGIDASITTKELTSNVNAFPFILNHYLGYDIPYLPECNFSAGNKFVLYDFSLLTGRLNNGTDPASCKQYE